MKIKPIFFVLLFVSIVYILTASNTPPQTDGGCYTTLARSLASGHGYRQYPLSNEPHTKYPYLYPILIAPLQKFFPADFYLLYVLNALFTILSAYLVFFIFKSLFSEKLATLLTFVVSLNAYTFVQYVHKARPEALYTLASLLAIVLIEKYVVTRANRFLFLSALAISGACYSKQIGFTLIISGIIYLLYHKNWKAALTLGLVSTLLISPWWHRVLTQTPSAVPPSDLNIPNQERWYSSFAAFFEHCSSWAHWVVFPTFFSFFRFVKNATLENTTNLGVIKNIITFAICIPTGIGFFFHLRQRRYFFDFYVPIYLMIITVSGNYMAYRLLYPIVPFLFYYLITGTNVTFGQLSRSFSIVSGWKISFKLLKIVLLCLVVYSALLQNFHQIYWQRTGRLTRPWNAYFEAAKWVRSNLPDNAVVMCQMANNFYLVANRISVDPPLTMYTDETYRKLFMGLINDLNVRYVVVTVPSFASADMYGKNYMLPVVEKGKFKLLTVIKKFGGEARVYEVKI